MKPEALRSLVLFRWYFHNTVRKKKGGVAAAQFENY